MLALYLDLVPADPSPVEPALSLLSPLHPEGTPRDQLADEVCLAADFRPREGELVLNVKEGQVNRSTGGAVLSLNTKTFFYAGFINKTIYSCQLHGQTSSCRDCRDVHPENARLHFFLLMMNGVRVVFTKTLALSTVLTIRAVLF